MDIPQLVRLRTVLTSSAGRRSLLRGLAAVTLVSAPGAPLEEVVARRESIQSDKKRTRKSWFCLNDRSIKSRNKRKIKKLRRQGAVRGRCNCVPDTSQVTCAGRCGKVQDNCGGPAYCGFSSVAPVAANQATFGATGSGQNELQSPYALEITTDELVVYVADFDNDRISVWSRPSATSPDWTNLTTFGDAGPDTLDGPAGVALSGNELQLYVTDYANNRVTIWSRPDTDGQAWAFAGEFGAGGITLGQFDGPRSLALSADELTMYVADSNNGRISIWTRLNASTTAWTNVVTFGLEGTGPYELSQPMDLRLSADELTLYLADSGNFRVSIWARSDTSRMDWNARAQFGAQGVGPDQFLLPSGVALAADELTIWVADTDNNRISVWSRPTTNAQTWTSLSTFGTEGIQPSDFDDPVQTRISADSSTLWVVDHLNNRISVWTQTCPA